MRHWKAAAHTEQKSHRDASAVTAQLNFRCISDGVKWCTNATTASFEKPRDMMNRIVAAYSLYAGISDGSA